MPLRWILMPPPLDIAIMPLLADDDIEDDSLMNTLILLKRCQPWAALITIDSRLLILLLIRCRQPWSPADIASYCWQMRWLPAIAAGRHAALILRLILRCWCQAITLTVDYWLAAAYTLLMPLLADFSRGFAAITFFIDYATLLLLLMILSFSLLFFSDFAAAIDDIIISLITPLMPDIYASFFADMAIELSIFSPPPLLSHIFFADAAFSLVTITDLRQAGSSAGSVVVCGSRQGSVRMRSACGLIYFQILIYFRWYCRRHDYMRFIAAFMIIAIVYFAA